LLVKAVGGGAALDTAPEGVPKGPPREAGIRLLTALQRLLTDSMFCVVECGMLLGRCDVSRGEMVEMKEETREPAHYIYNYDST
jgi:hypothetical protein